MQRSKIEHRVINRLIIRWIPDNYNWYFWLGDQGILGVGNRHDNMNINDLAGGIRSSFSEDPRQAKIFSLRQQGRGDDGKRAQIF